MLQAADWLSQAPAMHGDFCAVLEIHAGGGRVWQEDGGLILKGHC